MSSIAHRPINWHLTLTSFKMCGFMKYICMPNMQVLSVLFHKLWPMLKLDTNKQTDGAKQYAPTFSGRGIKISEIIFFWYSCHCLLWPLRCIPTNIQAHLLISKLVNPDSYRIRQKSKKLVTLLAGKLHAQRATSGRITSHSYINWYKNINLPPLQEKGHSDILKSADPYPYKVTSSHWNFYFLYSFNGKMWYPLQLQTVQNLIRCHVGDMAADLGLHCL